MSENEPLAVLNRRLQEVQEKVAALTQVIDRAQAARRERRELLKEADRTQRAIRLLQGEKVVARDRRDGGRRGEPEA